MSAPLTLYLDTTTSRLMMGLGQGERLIAERVIACDSHRYHSALIVPAIQDLLRDSSVSVRGLMALGINHGPGSFTGIRTGIITVRTMAQFLDLPVQVFNSFELLAVDHNQPVHIYLDALRGRVYRATLQWEASGPVYHQSPALGLMEEALAIEPDSPILISPTLASHFPEGAAQLIPEDVFTPARMAALAARYPAYGMRSWQDVRPLYLQEPSITLKKPKPSPTAQPNR